MSKVEMSLKEYDELMDKVRKYERVIKCLTTPRIDDWEYNYFKEESSRHMNVYSHVTDSEILNFIRGKILEAILEDTNLQDKLESYEPEFSDLTINLFSISHNENQGGGEE